MGNFEKSYQSKNQVLSNISKLDDLGHMLLHNTSINVPISDILS